MLPSFRFRRREIVIRPIEMSDSQALAALHAEDFFRPWVDSEFESLLSQPAVFGFVAVEDGVAGARPCGFVLARKAAGEAEILTITVARSCRRRGIGRALLDAVLRMLHAERIEALFLEVDENNAAAVALYRRLGFREVGMRPDYYDHEASHRTHALVMRRDLRQTSPSRQ